MRLFEIVFTARQGGYKVELPREPVTRENPSMLRARAVVQYLVEQGVREVVYCPGSRSAPLAYALADAERAHWIRVHVRLDERAAAFFALGLSRAGQVALRWEEDPLRPVPGARLQVTGVTTLSGARPVAVVTTSGTAVANLHPALLEAAHSAIPLIAVTADRPQVMRGTGANQTTIQTGIFGSAARLSLDIATDEGPGSGLRGQIRRLCTAALGSRSGNPGPVHLNIAFAEPLTPATSWQPREIPVQDGAIAGIRSVEPYYVDRSKRTVVVAGEGSGPAARILAEAGNWPLFAEPSSQARAGRMAITHYPQLLATELALDTERAIVFGHPTLSREIANLLARDDLEIIVVAPEGDWTDVSGTVGRVVTAVTVAEDQLPYNNSWLKRWLRADFAWKDPEIRSVSGIDRRQVAEAIWLAHTPVAAPVLFVGASSPLRTMDRSIKPEKRSPLILANRGLSGIDGTVATAWGIAAGTGQAVRAVMGDLTFFHDASALLRGESEDDVNLQVVVLDDRGGSIFASLEHGKPEFSGVFNRFFRTPQQADIINLAKGFGANVSVVSDIVELVRVLNLPVRGRSVLLVNQAFET